MPDASMVFVSEMLLTGDDGIVGANSSARTAIDAGVGINYIDFAFRN